jgi:hypothetical protein
VAEFGGSFRLKDGGTWGVYERVLGQDTGVRPKRGREGTLSGPGGPWVSKESGGCESKKVGVQWR